jgi:glycerol kinase
VSGILVVDVGTSGLRAGVVDDELKIAALDYRPFPPQTPAPGLVEFNASEMARVLLEAASSALEQFGRPVTCVGITNQRASTLLWDRATGEPIGPGLGWQDLRTIGECIVAKAEHGWPLAPNQSVTKIAWLLDNVEGARDRDLCFGTVDSWIAWTLTRGELHITDQTNASATTTGLRSVDGSAWNDAVLEAFDIPAAILPDVVDSIGVCGEATALPGSPPIAAILGDQQGSLVGQGCVRPGQTKITFGSGGMLDICSEMGAPTSANRSATGTYPLPVWSRDGELTWGVEGIMLSAGTNVDWLRDDMQLIDTVEESHDIAATCDDTAGVVYVPALLGLGTPWWDYGARGTLLGLTRGTGRAHVVRAVLEGVAHRGADLVEAAAEHTGLQIESVRVDGGMSRNPTFVQALADATGRRVEVSPVVDSTVLGAAFLAGLATGTWGDLTEVDEKWDPAHVAEPSTGRDREADRATWAKAIDRAAGWLPELSALEF